MKTKNKFPKNFFQNLHNHVKEIDDEQKDLPFKWDKDVLNGKTKVIITKAKISQNDYFFYFKNLITK